MTEALKLAPFADREAAWAYINAKFEECRKGISDCERECLAIAEQWQFDKSDISYCFRTARDARAADKAAALIAPEAKAAPEVGSAKEGSAKDGGWGKRRSLGEEAVKDKAALFIYPRIQPEVQKVQLLLWRVWC